MIASSYHEEQLPYCENEIWHPYGIYGQFHQEVNFGASIQNQISECFDDELLKIFHF